MAGNLPAGWSCSASLAGSAAAPTTRAGVPRTFIYNGGDASGSIDDVHWSAWGGEVAHGRGRHPVFKPRGGYYRHPVVALLKAVDIQS